MYFYFLIVTLLVVQCQGQGSEKNVSGEVPAPGTLNNHEQLDSVCEEGWKRFQNSTHCLKVFSEKMAYNEARNACQEMGGDLAQTDSEAKNKFAGGLVSNESDVWIGVFRENQDQPWTYVDGTQMNYSHWTAGDPLPEPSKNCVNMSNQGYWSNSHCDKNRKFVCEMDAVPFSDFLRRKIVERKQELKSKDEAFEKKFQALQNLFTKLQLEQETELNAFQNLTDQVKIQRETPVRFTASHYPERFKRYIKGYNLVYRNVIESVGWGYRPHNGTFIATVPGYYFFSLSVFTSRKQYLFIDLRNQKGKILATLRSGDGDGWFGQGATTCIVKMDIADQVAPVISELNGRSPVSMRYRFDRLNLFYGYLLKAI